jgi:CO/xanthine dehydrogenase Mo-binding subunit
MPAPSITDVAKVKPVPPTQDKSDQGEPQPSDTHRGDADGAFASAALKVNHEYVIPRENHNCPQSVHRREGWVASAWP